MEQTKAAKIFEMMMEKDSFTAWLGATCIEVGDGFCCLTMTIRTEMCNGFGIAHGGITYSLADSALAFASNSHGWKALSIETAISHLQPLYTGDVITAIAKEKSLGKKIAVYEVTITKGDEAVALFKGTVYRKSEKWLVG